MYTYSRVTSICIDLSKIKLFVFVNKFVFVDTLTCLDDAHIYAKAKTLLQKRYGSSFIISEAYREKISSWPRIQVKDGISLRNFGDFLQQCLISKDSV